MHIHFIAIGGSAMHNLADNVAHAFGKPWLQVFTGLFDLLLQKNWSDRNLLIMTSGNFSGMDLKEPAKKSPRPDKRTLCFP